MHHKKAFTLAEVLITLVVIGIIAAITVPMIHTNYQKQATVYKLKKAYANLSNIIKLSEVDNGPMHTWEFLVAFEDTESFVKKYFSKYIITNSYSQKNVTDNSNVLYNIDGDVILQNQKWYNLADSTSFSLFKATEPANDDVDFIWLFIDLNAYNSPNKLGKDVFMFEIYREKRLEFWANKDSNAYPCKKGTGQHYAGGGCGTWIFNNGFEIPKDYPW